MRIDPIRACTRPTTNYSRLAIELSSRRGGGFGDAEFTCRSTALLRVCAGLPFRFTTRLGTNELCQYCPIDRALPTTEGRSWWAPIPD